MQDRIERFGSPIEQALDAGAVAAVYVEQFRSSVERIAKCAEIAEYDCTRAGDRIRTAMDLLRATSEDELR